MFEGLRYFLKGPKWDYSERRRFARVNCELDGVARTGGYTHQVEILNLSASGLGMRCYGRLRRGQTLSIHLRKSFLAGGCEPVQAQVVWHRREGLATLCGLRFVDTVNFGKTWAYHEIESRGGALTNEARPLRFPCFMACRVGVVENRGLILASIRSLGTDGAVVIIKDSRLEPGTEAVLDFGDAEELPRVCLLARVTAARDYRYDFEFLEFRNDSLQNLHRHLDRLVARSQL